MAKAAKKKTRVVAKATAPPSNLETASNMFQDLLSKPNASSALIAKLSGINTVAISQLKNGKLPSITDAMFGKLKKVYDGVTAGKVSFDVKPRGRKGRKPTAKTVKPVPTAAPKPILSTNPAIKLFAEQQSITDEQIAQKEMAFEVLRSELEYLKDMKKLQEKYKGRLF